MSNKNTTAGGRTRTARSSERAQNAERAVDTLTARFLLSAASFDQCPADDQREVAFIGRSNVGKSSSLNRLTGSRRLARVSKTPGRTQLLNFFAVKSGGRLVDLPGFGYAKASRDKQSAWSRLIDDYLTKRRNLAAVALIIDARHPLQPFERDIHDWAAAAEVPVVVLLNKADKLKQGARVQARRAVDECFADLPRADVVLFSAQTGLGLQRAVDLISSFLGAAPGRHLEQV